VTNSNNIEDIYPLSPIQQGILYHSLLDEGRGTYFEQLCYKITGPLDQQALRRAWARVLERHAALRSAPIWDRSGEPVQAVLKLVNLEWDERDWRPLAADMQEQQLELFLRSDRERGFDLSVPPLFRLTMIQTGDWDYQLVWSHHHLLLDGWAASIVLREVAEIYEADVNRQEPSLRARLPFRDYILWLRTQDQAAASSFWRQTLKDWDSSAPLLNARYERSDAESDSQPESLLFSASETKALESFARSHGFTVSTVWLGGWALLLSRYSGRHEVLFGVTVSGRPADLDGAEDMVGMFINTIPFRVTLTAQTDTVGWLRGIQSAFAKSRGYDYYPLAYIQKESCIPAGEQLFDTLVVIENYPPSQFAPERNDGLSISRSTAFEKTNYPLTVEIGPGKETSVQIIYDSRQFDGEAVRRMLQQYTSLIRQLISRPSRLYEYTLGGDWDCAPSSAQPPGVARCIYDLFEAQALCTSGAIAVRHEESHISFVELYWRANRLAHFLGKLGAAPESRIGICLSRSPMMIEAILGTMAAGAAYVPLDSDWPSERIRCVLETLNISILLTERTVLPAPPETSVRVVWLEEITQAVSSEPSTRPRSCVEPSNLAYVLCTSGSTGAPKGVAIEQRNTVALLDWAVTAFSAEELAAVAFSTSLQFDISVFEILAPLVSGGSIVIVPDVLNLSCNREADAITLVNTVPSAMAEVLQMGSLPTAVRTVNLAGEPLPNSLAQALYSRAKVQRVLNLYGPTEDTTYSTMAEVEKGATADPSIGQPILFKSAIILDWVMQPVPRGVPGELYLSGGGLTRGYLNEPGLTAERFVPLLRPGSIGERLYRTGDLARSHHDSRIEYLGRSDQQVKVRGFRIELAEIESELALHPAVARAAVVVRDGGAGKRLVAFVILKQGESTVAADLRAWLSAKLPHYMVPAQIFTLDTFPLLPSGKLDRKTLARWVPPRPTAVNGQDASLVKAVVSSIWAQLLELQSVDHEATFFEQGGHSLLASRLVSRLRDVFGADLSLRAVFETATINGISEYITDALRVGKHLSFSPIKAMAQVGEAPCSFAQQRIWFLEQLKPNSPSYNVVNAMRLVGSLDVEALERSLTELTRRHVALRTSISRSLPPSQIIHSVIPVQLPLTETSTDLNAVQALIADEALRPFDLHEGPLMRGHLFRLSVEDHVLVLTLHHLICDGWSLGILARDLSVLYNAEVEGRPLPLPELAVQYADFARWERHWLSGEVLEEHLAYWRQQLKPPLPALMFSGARSRLTIIPGPGRQQVLSLPRELSDELRQVARQHGVTLFILIAAALEVLQYCYTGKTDVLIGADINNRDRTEFEDVVGLFVNQIVLRVDLSGDPSFLQIAKRVRERLIDAFIYGHLPFEKIVDEMNKSGNKDRHSVFPVKLVVQNAPQHEVKLHGLRVSPIPVPHVGSKIDWTLAVEDTPEGLRLISDYDDDLFSPTTMGRLLGDFQTLLNHIMADPRRHISSLSILSASGAGGFGSYTFADSNSSQREFDFDHPRSSSTDHDDMGAPGLAETDTEKILTDIWRVVLPGREFDAHQNFFDLGGNSLLAVDVYARICQAIPKKNISLVDLLEYPTICKLAARIDGLEPDAIAFDDGDKLKANQRILQARSRRRRSAL
jgi:amino acid adenylation domain-containing protein